MPNKGHTEQQIVAVLRQAEAGEKASELCRNVGDQRSDLLCLEETVRWAQQTYQIGLRRAVRLMKVGWSTWVYRRRVRQFRQTLGIRPRRSVD
jgi:hypothetical protein